MQLPEVQRTSSSSLTGCIRAGDDTQRHRSCLHRYRFSRCVCWQYLASTHNRRTYARCFTVTTFPVTNSIHRVAVIGVPLLNGFLHAFIISYTKERGNAHSSPTYSLWSLKWESPARNRMNMVVVRSRLDRHERDVPLDLGVEYFDEAICTRN
ncbi:hypothetical protein AF6_2344 [Anoxybacillus flavithermus TNO-09.006]|nr:hypothetical protein AF6_2344 [Anoxybacillus flavithermus TNO-09.006]